MAGGTRRPPRSLRGASARTRREGVNGFAHAQVAQIQRARILTAMFDVAAQRGAANASVAHVVERSGVSRRTFYEVFADREDCFLAAFEDALALASRPVLVAYRAEARWRQQIRAGLCALLCFLDEEPVIGRLLIVESLSGGGAKTLELRDRTLAQVVAAVDGGRRARAAGTDRLPTLTAEGLVGGALSLIHARIVRAEHEPLLGLANQLMSMIVLPYLGPAAARRELERPVQPRVSDRREDARLLEDPFKGAGMRLTYRTVRVLLAIAERPNASNRLIADTAEIKDQGQISKLLARLERAGLISNSSLGPGQGAPNAWTLTQSGQQVATSIRAQTEDHRQRTGEP